MTNSKPVSMPLEPGTKLSRLDVWTEDDGARPPYRELTGALMNLSTATRPDIAHAARKLCQYNDKFIKSHWAAAKCALRSTMLSNPGCLCTGTTLLIAGISSAMYLIYKQLRKGASGYSILSTSDTLATTVTGILFFLIGLETPSTNEILQRNNFSHKCDQRKLILTSALFLAPFVNAFMSILAHSAECYHDVRNMPKESQQKSKFMPKGPTRIGSALLAQWVVPLVTTMSLLSSNMELYNPNLRTETTRQCSLSTVAPIATRSQHQCLQMRTNYSDGIETTEEEYRPAANYHQLINNYKNTIKNDTYRINNITSSIIEQIHSLVRKSRSKIQVSNENRTQPLHSAHNTASDKRTEFLSTELILSKTSDETEISDSHDSNFNMGDTTGTTIENFEQYEDNAQPYEYELPSRFNYTQMDKNKNTNDPSLDHKNVLDKVSTSNNVADAGTHESDHHSMTTVTQNSTPSTDDIHIFLQPPMATKEDTLSVTSYTQTTATPLTTTTQVTSTFLTGDTDSNNIAFPVDIALILQQTINASINNDNDDIITFHDIVECIGQCLHTGDFLKVHLFVILFTCYFVPITVALLIYSITQKNLMQISKTAIKHNKDAEASTDENHSNAGCADDTRYIEKLTKLNEITKRFIIISVTLLTPIFIETLVRVWFCVNLPTWMSMLFFLLSQTHSLLRNIYNVRLVNVYLKGQVDAGVCRGAMKKSDGIVHPKPSPSKSEHGLDVSTRDKIFTKL